MTKRKLTPNTTLYPVPVVLVSCGADDEANLITVNRIASCNAEPPMICLALQPRRASHDLVARLAELVVNIPRPDMELVTDFAGTTTVRNIDKWQQAGLTPLPASQVRPPLVAECPVNLECRVSHTVKLPTHTLFVAEVVAMHADEAVLDEKGEVDFDLAGQGLAYRSGAVRERPVAAFDPEMLWRQVQQWRDLRQTG